MDKDKKNIYNKLRELRRARGFTVNTFAEKIGENYQKVGRIERGTRSLTVDYLVKVAQALETPLETILTESSQTKTRPHSEGKFDGVSTSDILNKIVIFVEEYSVIKKFNTEQKAKLISHVYQQALKFSPADQSVFLDALFKSMMFS